MPKILHKLLVKGRVFFQKAICMRKEQGCNHCKQINLLKSHPGPNGLLRKTSDIGHCCPVVKICLRKGALGSSVSENLGILVKNQT